MYADRNIKEKVLTEMDSLSDKEQETILGIVENYISNQLDETEWNQLPLPWKKRIEESLKQADEGKFITNNDALAYIRRKHNIND